MAEDSSFIEHVSGQESVISLFCIFVLWNLQWKSMGYTVVVDPSHIQCMDKNIIQNISFCDPQNKETRTCL